MTTSTYTAISTTLTDVTGRSFAHRGRFIPAGAGNAGVAGSARGGGAVHPRGCGERSAPVRWFMRSSGSSPRVRGTPARVRVPSQQSRFIPAGAGNAHSRPSPWRPAAVHPRGCGERSTAPITMPTTRGSSPRVRGTHSLSWGGGSNDRFIPAGAGNAPTPPGPRCAPPVHPRGCGERLAMWHSLPGLIGSSPRVRGTLRPAQAHHLGGRFIPAGAGNAVAGSSRRRPASVHPRGCGERAASGTIDGAASGSSPRVRGTLKAAPATVEGERFIPAGAGNARTGRVSSVRAAVHPRGCGERV